MAFIEIHSTKLRVTDAAAFDTKRADNPISAFDVDPLTYLTDVLTRIVNGHPNSDIDQLLPWAYRMQDL